ncbi:MAG: hypothetical protein JWQ01_3476 [Massilia sp.]|nr:hypothetical protein [Massilia sp.]
MAIGRLLLLIAMMALLPATASDTAAQARWLAGQAIYRDGVLGFGAPLAGVGAAGVLRQGREAACIACHRRSGFGIAEGALLVRPITAPDLFQDRLVTAATPRIAHQLGTPRRPAYDAAALAAALRNGTDVTGRSMHSMMPRYALGEADMAALQEYLRSLYAAPDPGVDDSEIRLATVIQPDVAPARRQAVLDVLDAFVRDKNAGVRSELARRQGGAMRMHRSYRTWTLDVWQLTGAPDGWPAQLEQFYRRRPVFALVSGIGDAGWQPIQDFSERFQVPCILPLTSLPGAGPNFYTVYFSRGIALEAQALAGHLGTRAAVTQVFRRDQPASLAAADAFRKAVPAGVRLQDRALEGPMTATQWRTLNGDVLVLWLGADDLRDAPARNTPTWLSATLMGDAPAPGKVGLTYPWELPQLRAPRVRRSTDWLRARNIGAAALQDQVNAHYAITMAGEALAHLMDSFSRDYFVETIEHDISTTLLSSFYPPLTLGPDQRFASKGVYVLDPALPDATRLLVPDNLP